MDAKLESIERRARALELGFMTTINGIYWIDYNEKHYGIYKHGLWQFNFASDTEGLTAAERLLALYEAGTEREHAIEHLKWPPRWYEKQVVGFITIDGEIYDMSNSPKYKAHVEVDDCQRLVSIAEFEAQGGEETGVIVDVPEAVEMMSQGHMYRIALNLPTGMKAGPYRLVRKGGEGPVVVIRQSCHPEAGDYCYSCQLHHTPKVTKLSDYGRGECILKLHKWFNPWSPDDYKIPIPGPDCPGAGRYRLVRVADVEVGDAR